MKTVALSIFLLVVLEAVPGFGKKVTTNCPLQQDCPKNPTCPANQVLVKDVKGCCCRPACKQNEVYTCLCADKVCNEPQKVCIRCADGCYCRAGYVRDKPDGKCIPEKRCPVKG